MRESAARILGDDGTEGVPAEAPRLITADSFRALMARLAPKPAIPANDPQIPEIEPEIPAAAPGPEAMAEISEPADMPVPSAENAGFDWSSLAASPPLVDEAPDSEPEPAAPVVATEFEPVPDPQPETPPEDPGISVFTIDLDAVQEPQQLEWPELVDSLNERLRTNSTLLKRVETELDPFAQPAPSLRPRSSAGMDIAEPDQGSEEVARSLLGIMSAPSGASQPQERALAADTLLRLIPRLSVRTLITIADRVSVMENPPPLLIGRLLRDPRDEVAGPLLERAGIVTDQDLMSVIAEGDAAKQRMIARRRVVSPALADALIANGELAAIMALVRNPGASLSQDAFSRLCALAREHSALQAPLATRPDTPAPVAFELFWIAPPELRRLVLSRFLTDSETLNRILKITMAVDADSSGIAAAEVKLPPKQKLEELIDLIERGDDDKAAQFICELANICEATARRILADRQGEPLTVMLKALGLQRGRLTNVIERLRVSSPPRIAFDRAPADLQAIFDTLSFNKTRVLLTYWDWAAQTAGPYAHLATET